MSEYLPQEIVINILKRLPIKTLLRCTSICKAWYTLVTSSYFITTHLNFNKNNTPHILLRYCKDLRSHEENYALYYDNETFDLHTEFEFPFESFHGIFQVVGSCNGLICLLHCYMKDPDRIILWNPFINKAVYLPAPIYYFEPSLAFGFDFATSDYKLVRLVHVDKIYPKVDIYRLSTRIWEDISHLALPYYIPTGRTAVYVNEAAHWIGSDRIGSDESWKSMIVLFHMHNEVFREIMLPSSLVNQDFCGCNLFDCQGTLCLINSFPDERGDRRSDIWLMKEYGVAESWFKRFTVDISSLRFPVSFRNSGEILWAIENGCLISYHPQKKQMMDLDIRGIDRFQRANFHYVGTYMESLVLLDKMVDIPDSDTSIIGSSVECNEENHEMGSSILEVEEAEQARLADFLIM